VDIKKLVRQIYGTITLLFPDTCMASYYNFIMHVAIYLYNYIILYDRLISSVTFAGVILVTDGVCGFVGSGVMNTLVGQMRRSNISCWALLVGGNPSPMCW